jgi:transcriptional regulator with XRE-family HTH domain
MIKNIIQERIQQIVKDSNVSIEEQVEALKISTTLLGKYRKGVTVPGSEILFRMAQYYNKPIQWFFGEDDQTIEFHYEEKIREQNAKIMLLQEKVISLQDVIRKLYELKLADISALELEQKLDSEDEKQNVRTKP